MQNDIHLFNSEILDFCEIDFAREHIFYEKKPIFYFKN